MNYDNKFLLKVAVIALVFSIIGSCSISIIQKRYFDVSPAVVRIDEILSRHVKSYGEKELTKSDRELISAVFANSLQNSINQISKEQRVTLFAFGAAATTLPDYTEVINDQIERDITHALKNKAF